MTAGKNVLAPLAPAPAIMLLVIGAPFLLLGALEALDVLVYPPEYQVAQGVVVSVARDTYFDPEGSGAIHATYYPVVGFTNADGDATQFTDPIGAQEPHYEVGDPVRVLYNLHNPSEARLQTFDEPLAHFATGLFPITVLLVWAAWTRSSAKSRASA